MAAAERLLYVFIFLVFSDQQGLNAGRIAQIFLLNGLPVLYLGSFLTRFLGNAGAAVLGGAALGLFVLQPELSRAVFVILVMGLIDRFAYTAQASDYIALPATVHFGINKASGCKKCRGKCGRYSGAVCFWQCIVGRRTGGNFNDCIQLGCVVGFVLAVMRRLR